jgi:hypothetical protein
MGVRRMCRQIGAYLPLAHLLHLRDSLSITVTITQDGSTIIHTYPSWRSGIAGKYTLYRMYRLHGSVFLPFPPIEEGACTDI